MTPDQANEVWKSLDRDYLAGIVRRGPAPVFAALSGAHLYGFASADSDVDLRGAFILPVHDMLSLHPSNETMTITEKQPVDLDWVAHDIRKFARLMTAHSGDVLEQLYSPLVVLSTPWHEELRELGKGCITRQVVKHYQGFASGRRRRLHEPGATIKHLLYAYRVLLTGIHMMQAGEVVANITVLNEIFHLDEVASLVARKRSGEEKMPLQGKEVEAHEAVLNRLEEQLALAHAKSPLPEQAISVQALGDFVVRVRLEAAGLGAA